MSDSFQPSELTGGALHMGPDDYQPVPNPVLEELPDNFEEKANISNDAKQQNEAPPAPAIGPAAPPPKAKTADEVISMLNRTPLFMTSLDETDGEGGENVELAALRALQYEGRRSEIAGNFREQGNEQARAKNWKDAKEFYDQALTALKSPHEVDPDAMDSIELDEAAEAKKEQEIEEACHVNRALCNLELKNYRACNLDCAATLRLNPSNVKAWYRSSSACLALDKLPEAEDACNRGLEVDSKNAALKGLSAKIQKRKDYIAELERKRREREERELAEKRNLKLALKARNIPSRATDKAPDAKDAVLKLADPMDATSMLSIPVVLLYSVHLQSDFIKAFEEQQSLNDHLSYILPLPWDEAAEYSQTGVECYIETIAGGLIKAGKKLPLFKILGSGKVEIIDGLLRVHVLPKAKAANWIEEFKLKRPKA